MILGATATGKSALAVAVAERLGKRARVICCDSQQVYADVPIATGAPTPAQAAAVPHCCWGYALSSARHTVSDWADRASVALYECRADHCLPIVCGGSTNYLHHWAVAPTRVPAGPASTGSDGPARPNPSIADIERWLNRAHYHLSEDDWTDYATFVRQWPMVALRFHPHATRQWKRAREQVTAPPIPPPASVSDGPWSGSSRTDAPSVLTVEPGLAPSLRPLPGQTVVCWIRVGDWEALTAAVTARACKMAEEGLWCEAYRLWLAHKDRIPSLGAYQSIGIKELFPFFAAAERTKLTPARVLGQLGWWPDAARATGPRLPAPAPTRSTSGQTKALADLATRCLDTVTAQTLAYARWQSRRINTWLSKHAPASWSIFTAIGPLARDATLPNLAAALVAVLAAPALSSTGPARRPPSSPTTRPPTAKREALEGQDPSAQTAPTPPHGVLQPWLAKPPGHVGPSRAGTRGTPVPGQIYWCEVCGRPVFSQNEWLKHIRSRAHRRQARAKPSAKRPSPGATLPKQPEP